MNDLIPKFVHGALVCGLLSATSSFALPLRYVFTGEFFAGSFLDGDLIDERMFEVNIFADTAVVDTVPGDTDRGEFPGPFSAEISIQGLGVFTFVNPISMIREWLDAPDFAPVESKAFFGGDSTSTMTGFSEDTLSPFFGDPNLLDAFAGGAGVVVVNFNSEPVVPVGGTESILLNGQSGGGTLKAITVPESGYCLFLLSGSLTILGGCRLLRRSREDSTGRRRETWCHRSRRT